MTNTTHGIHSIIHNASITSLVTLGREASIFCLASQTDSSVLNESTSYISTIPTVQKFTLSQLPRSELLKQCSITPKRYHIRVGWWCWFYAN